MQLAGNGQGARGKALRSFMIWLRILGACAAVALLAYGCNDLDCRRTFTCTGDASVTIGSSRPDASMDDEGAMALRTCREGQHSCIGVCVDDDDPLNCGTSCSPCDVPVDGQATCDGVRCGGACEDGKKLCFGFCIDDADVCERSCNEGTHECSGLCVSDDSVNACGNSCDPCSVPENAREATCDGGECGFVCVLGYHQCGDTCQRDTLVSACGPNCEPCGEIENGFPACNNRVCTVWCNQPTDTSAGYHPCNEECVANDSPESCGTTSCTPCTAPIGGTATCNDGQCGTACPDGEKLCAGACISGRIHLPGLTAPLVLNPHEAAFIPAEAVHRPIRALDDALLLLAAPGL